MITNIKYEVSVKFEGVNIIVEYSDYENQPQREKYLFIKIYGGNKEKLKCDDPLYSFIESRFKKSELFKGIVERFKFNCA